MPKPLSMQALDSSAYNEFWAEERAGELFKLHNLDSLGWTFKIGHSQRTLGWCKYRQKTIEFSKHFVHLDRAEIEDVILHEIAHALVYIETGKNHGHDAVWRAKCREIGARPERLAPPEIKSGAKHNYVIICSGCGEVIGRRYRLREALLRRYVSKCCGEKLDYYEEG